MRGAPRDELELAARIAEAMDAIAFFCGPPHLDGRETEDVIAELLASWSTPRRKR